MCHKLSQTGKLGRLFIGKKTSWWAHQPSCTQDNDLHEIKRGPTDVFIAVVKPRKICLQSQIIKQAYIEYFNIAFSRFDSADFNPLNYTNR